MTKEQFAEEYCIEKDDDCLCNRTNPGTLVGEHIYAFCGCHLYDAILAGWDKSREVLLKESDEFDSKKAENAAWIELVLNELPAQRPTEDNPDIEEKYDEQQDCQRLYFEAGAQWQHSQDQIKIQALREEIQRLKEKYEGKL